MSSSQNIEQQLTQFRTKYEQEVKKNNSLLKMNSNLMRQNQFYLNCFSVLKKWSNNLNSKFMSSQQQSGMQFDDSCIDVQEQGQDFVTRLCEFVDKKIDDLSAQIDDYRRQIDFLMASPTNSNTQTKKLQLSQYKKQRENHECFDCTRWKQMYIKQTKQTTKLQKIIDQSALFNTQKQLNFAKLKDDTLQLLENYLKLYRIKLQVNNITEKTVQQSDEGDKLIVNNNHNKQTVRPKEKTKQKRSGSNSGHKNKKSTYQQGNNQSSLQVNKQPTPFSKQKTSRNNAKYTIQLSPQKSSTSLKDQKINTILPFAQSNQLSKCLNDILSSYSQLSKNLQQQNCQLKQQLKDLTEILCIYRERQRNQILFK